VYLLIQDFLFSHQVILSCVSSSIFDKDFADFLFPVSRHFPLHHIMCLKAFFQKVSCL